MAKNVTAFQLDPNIAVAPDGGTIPGFPGVWKPGEAYHPEALGMTLAEMRDLVERVNAPLQEVTVSERKALRAFDVPSTHLASEPSVTHPAAAGPGFGEPELTAEADTRALERRADQLDIVEQEGVTPAEADQQLSEEGK